MATAKDWMGAIGMLLAIIAYAVFETGLILGTLKLFGKLP